MKIAGKEITKATEDVLVFPRGTSDPIVFKSRSIETFEPFTVMCPSPKVPKVLTSKGEKDDFDDLGYQQQMEAYAIKRLGWTVIKTLEPSEIEWDILDLEKPETYGKWEEEFREAGFTVGEINRILAFVVETNSLSEAKLKQARADFLRTQEAAQLP